MKKVRWGILGCGNIAGKFAEALQAVDNIELQSVAARDVKRASDFARKWDFKKAYASYRELVNDPEVDIIYIATPHSYHYAHARLCLEAGKHVLCEKPFTINSAQLDELFKLAAKHKLFLMEALWSRFLPGIQEAKRLIDQGELGKIISMEADFGINFPYDPEHRIYNPLLAGGALLDIGIYPLFLSLYLFGNPDKIMASSVLHENGIDLSTSLILEHPGRVVSHLNSTIQADTPVKARIYGTEASIEFENWWFTPVAFDLVRDRKSIKTLDFPPMVNGYEYEAIEASRCLQEGLLESPVMPHAFSRDLMLVMDQIREKTKISYPAAIESVDKAYGWNELD